MRRRVYDAAELARNMREEFSARPIEQETELSFGWPDRMHAVGDSLAVAYSSDKWQKPDARGAREFIDYKHLSESRNRVLIRPGLLRDFHRPGSGWPVVGPVVSLVHVPLPDTFAELDYFLEADLQLYCAGDDEHPEFGPGEDDGIVKVTVRHGLLGASKIRWSQVDAGRDEPFLFVYTEREGVLMLIVGERLDVKRDGIVG